MKKDFENILAFIIVIISLVMITIGILRGLSVYYPELHDRALFGESTGFVAVIFSGVSILLVILSLQFQIDNLDETRKIQEQQINLLGLQHIHELKKRKFILEEEILDLGQKTKSIGSQYSKDIEDKKSLKEKELKSLKKQIKELENE